MGRTPISSSPTAAGSTSGIRSPARSSSSIWKTIRSSARIWPPPAAEKSYPLNPVADYGSTKKFEGHGGLLSCSGPPALLGFFDGPNASKYFMIVNRNPAKAAEFTLTFSDEVTSLGEIDRSRNGGPIRPVETTDGKLKLKLTAGDGRLFQLKAAP